MYLIYGSDVFVSGLELLPHFISSSQAFCIHKNLIRDNHCNVCNSFFIQDSPCIISHALWLQLHKGTFLRKRMPCIRSFHKSKHISSNLLISERFSTLRRRRKPSLHPEDVK
ncbi:hypothetical protein KP509_04G021200 [Ceratopteris richardii]|uniref:Uncharacterized protein n=1 Tax=Ceratopteris richardii TaxID=49495 RepID=A0A8T2UYC5_CERRI|nr:hypothetical protein KP509_04G021200 [Ceratopteris richardii]